MNENVTYTVTANDLLSGKLQSMNAQAQGLESTLAGLGPVIASVFSVYAVGNFVSKVIEAGTTVENATTGLTTLLGDSAEAARVVKNEMEDATKTPFAFEGLLAANKALIGAGIGADKARQDVLNLANAIAATGGGDDELQRMVVNMQQISNTGKATAADIKQFAFAGINIYKVLAEATGKPIEKVKDMEISYDMLTFALKKAHDQGGIYYNGLENMAGNTSVKISNVGDAIFQFMNDVFIKTKPLIDGALDTVLGFVAGLRDMYHWMQRNREVIEFVAIAIGGATTALILYNTYVKISAAWAAFTATSYIAEAFSLAALTAGMGGASVVGMTWAGVMGVVNAVLMANPVLIIVAAIGLAIAVVYEAIKAWDDWGAALILILGPLGLLISAVMTLQRHWDSIKKAFTEGGIIEGLKRIGIVLLDTVLYPIQKAVEWVAKLTGADWAKGAAESIKAMRKQMDLITPEETEKKTAADSASRKPKAVVPGKTPTTTTAKDKAKDVTGSKVVTINISIGNLVNDFTVKTTNLTEGAKAVHDEIVKALTSAVNDSQIVASGA